jgi:ribosomal protein S18 acetylase RimI-like enzyme
MCEPAKQQVTIRPVTQADLAAVQNVLVTTWHATYDASLGKQQVDVIVAQWHSMEALERRRLVPGCSFLLAEKVGRVVATAFARPGVDGCVQLSHMYVLPEAQRHGVGRQLLETSLAAFSQARTVRLEVMADNADAITFYERAGFQVVGEGDDCYGCGARIRHLIMEKCLEPGCFGPSRRSSGLARRSS